MKIQKLLLLLLVSNFVFAAQLRADNYSPELQARIEKIQKVTREDLAEGLTDKARNRLEQAAGNFHAVEIELSLIQTLMQAGEYRHALSSAAHVQAEHPNSLETTLFYAWLLAIGGQTTPADQLIAAALQRQDDARLKRLREQIATRKLAAAEIPTSNALQLKPYVSAKFTTAEPLQQISTGVVIDNGKKIVVPLSAVENRRSLRVRNGLGRERNAVIEQKIPASGVAILVLDKPFKNVSTLVPDKTPFPGSPIYIVGFARTASDDADWPQLQVDILGTPQSQTPSNYPLHRRDAVLGSGVFNQQGKLIGMLTDGDTITMTPLDGLLVPPSAKAQALAPAFKLPLDELYEKALSNTVQVLGPRS